MVKYGVQLSLPTVNTGGPSNVDKSEGKRALMVDKLATEKSTGYADEKKDSSTKSGDGSSSSSGDSSNKDEAPLPLQFPRELAQNRDMSKGLKLEKVEVEDVVQLDLEDVGNAASVTAGCLIGYIVGKRTEATDIAEFSKTWNKYAKLQFKRHPSGWTIFKFEDEKQKHEVLTNGPYFTSGCPWVLKEIPAYFSFNDESFFSIPVWVTMPGLPLEFWNAKALSKIASRIGDPIATDECTATQARLSFARVLVEVDARKPLMREVPLKFPNGVHHNQAVHYEFEPKVCSTCNQVGHPTEKCRSIKPRGRNTSVVAKSQRVRTNSKARAGSYAAVVRPDLPSQVADLQVQPNDRANRTPLKTQTALTHTPTEPTCNLANVGHGKAMETSNAESSKEGASRIQQRQPSGKSKDGEQRRSEGTGRQLSSPILPKTLSTAVDKDAGKSTASKSTNGVDGVSKSTTGFDHSDPNDQHADSTCRNADVGHGKTTETNKGTSNVESSQDGASIQHRLPVGKNRDGDSVGKQQSKGQHSKSSIATDAETGGPGNPKLAGKQQSKRQYNKGQNRFQPLSVVDEIMEATVQPESTMAKNVQMIDFSELQEADDEKLMDLYLKEKSVTTKRKNKGKK